ncbi:hypothetical protein O6H91_Y571100 [Diphasiastrum complanatum]|nr:hypothetical protein O6H91_Y571100 [Diphasiastrum complanatum]
MILQSWHVMFIVCSASFKGYCSFEKNKLFATVKLISVTNEGTIQNAMADDGVPFYSPNKSMIWCISKLSLHATNVGHVSFDETMNEYYTYYDRNYNRSSTRIHVRLPSITIREHQQKQHIILISSLAWKMSIIIIVQTSNGLGIVQMFSLVWMISMLMM